MISHFLIYSYTQIRVMCKRAQQNFSLNFSFDLLFCSDGTRESSVVTKMFLVEEAELEERGGDLDLENLRNSRQPTAKVRQEYILN